jgi:RNA polymerase sigma factor (sigma-70 family)
MMSVTMAAICGCASLPAWWPIRETAVPEPERSPAGAPAVPGTSRAPEPEADAELAEKFRAFYRAHTTPLIAFLLMQGASLYDAADIVQDTMTTAYRRWRSIEHPRAWAYLVASRALVRRVSTVREEPVAEPPERHNPLIRATPTDCWEQQQDITRALATLPPRQRQVMAWTLAGYQPTEIADELRLTPETVRSNLYRARRALTAYLTETEDDR